MSTSYDGIEDLLKTQDRLQKNLDTLLGATSEACPEIDVPRSQQQDSFTQQPNQDTSNKDVVCSKCQHKHTTANCRSTYTTSGIFIGEGKPPPNHYWSKRNAKEAFEEELLKLQKRKKTS